MIAHAWQRFRVQRAALAGLILVLALMLLSLAAPAIAPQDPTDPLGFNPTDANHTPGLSWTFLLGADGRGRSVVALLLWGGRLTLPIGLGAALLAALLGVVAGFLATMHDDALDSALIWLMDIVQTAPPLLVLLAFSARLGGVSAPLILATFATTGWVAPARITRAAITACRGAPHLEAARAVGVTGPRLFVVHLLPEALAPVMVWAASAAATYMALESGLDFLGLGLPPGAISWGTALAGAQEALAAGNWWWLTFGGLALGLTTLALGATARGMARALDPLAVVFPPGKRDPTALLEEDALPSLSALWPRRLPGRLPAPAFPTRAALLLLAGIALIGAGIDVRAGHHAAQPAPDPAGLLQQALYYPQQTGQRFAYIATVEYIAAEDLLRGESLPWAAWSACPPNIRGVRCARSQAQLWFSGGRGRALVEGSAFVCTPSVTWGVNPMAGLAVTGRQRCDTLGPRMEGLGVTAARVRALLPALNVRGARLLGWDAVAGRRCWVLMLRPSGRACLDEETGLVLRLERLDRTGMPSALFRITEMSYGLDLASELFANPIPGGHGPLIDGLSQPLLDIQAADDQALFSALVPSFVPEELISQTPTFDSYYDDLRSYALEQRVRQAYINRAGKVALVLIETLPGSGWDAPPLPSRAQQVTVAGRNLLVWAGGHGAPTVVRVEVSGTAALISSQILPVDVLERVALGLQ